MPPLPRFDRILKSVLKQFKKNKYKTFALHPNLCPSIHTNQQTWNNANLLKKSSQNGLSSMKVHGPLGQLHRPDHKWGTHGSLRYDCAKVDHNHLKKNIWTNANQDS